MMSIESIALALALMVALGSIIYTTYDLLRAE